MHSFAWIGSVATALVWTSPALAQSQGGEDPPQPAEAEIVVTARYGSENAVTGTKIEAPLIEVPQSIAIVPGELTGIDGQSTSTRRSTMRAALPTRAPVVPLTTF